MKKEPGRKNILAKKMLVFLLIVAVAINVLVGIFVSQYYKDIRLDQYNKLAYSYTRTMARIIDGDRIKEYIDTGKTDEYYLKVHDYLVALVEESEDIEYAYVFQPLDNGLRYIWSNDIGEACNNDIAGYKMDYVEPYEGGNKKNLLEAMAQEEKIWFFETDYGYIATATSPIFDSDGNLVACAGIDFSATDINQEQFSFVLGIIVATVIIVVVACIILFFIVRKRMVMLINKIDSAARSFVKNIEGSEKLELEIKTGDEIEGLAESFETMSSDVRNYIAELSAVTAEKERIGVELDVATQIQASMLPDVLPDRGEFDIFATMTPAREVGGGFYDFFMVDDRHVAIVCADVSDKGVPAALFMVIGKTLIKDHTAAGADPGEVFTVVNRLLCEANNEGMFITAFEGVLDLVTGEFRYVNAGHEIPFICRKGEKFKPYPVKSGLMLAVMKDMKYESGSVMLEPGDRFFEYTDGVTEAADADRNLFGTERLEESLGRYSDQKAEELLPLVKADIDAFVNGAPQFDDIAMICLDYICRMED